MNTFQFHLYLYSVFSIILQLLIVFVLIFKINLILFYISGLFQFSLIVLHFCNFFLLVFVILVNFVILVFHIIIILTSPKLTKTFLIIFDLVNNNTEYFLANCNVVLLLLLALWPPLITLHALCYVIVAEHTFMLECMYTCSTEI